MAKPVKLDRVEFGWVQASSVKSWSFAFIRDLDGLSVVVEFQNSNPDDPLRRHLRPIRPHASRNPH